MMVAAGRGALNIADNPAMWISAPAEIEPKEMRNEDYTIGKRSDAMSLKIFVCQSSWWHKRLSCR